MGITSDLNATELWNILEGESGSVYPTIKKRLLEHSLFKMYKNGKLTADSLKEALGTPIVVVYKENFDNLSDFDKGGIPEGEDASNCPLIVHVAEDGYFERIVINDSFEGEYIDHEYTILLAIVTNYFTNLLEELRTYDMENNFSEFKFAPSFYHHMAFELYLNTESVKEYTGEYMLNNVDLERMDAGDEEYIASISEGLIDYISNMMDIPKLMVSFYMSVDDMFNHELFNLQ